MSERTGDLRLGVSFYYVGDVAKAAAMYSRMLGATPSYADAGWVQYSLEGGSFALHGHPDLPEGEGGPPRHGAIVSFHVSALQEALSRAREAGFHLVGELNVQPFGTVANLRDPWGNRLSLMQRA